MPRLVKRGGSTPTPFLQYLPSRKKLWCTPAERADTHPLSLLYTYMYSVILCISLELKRKCFIFLMLLKKKCYDNGKHFLSSLARNFNFANMANISFLIVLIVFLKTLTRSKMLNCEHVNLL